jgi:membrane associated rhomboid family serine protease
VTTDAFRRNSDNFCYRHPDRQSFVLCQRCLRTICPECQTQAAVGVICPECLRDQQRAQTPAQAKAERRWKRGGTRAVATDSRPLMTYIIIGLTVAGSLLQLLPGVTDRLLFWAPYVYPGSGAPFEPWRLLTVLLVHNGWLHLAFNMLALWMIGRSLEPLLGKWRFLTLYLLSGLGGSVAVALLSPATPVVGASGAIFGLFGALLVIGRHIGANITGIALVIGINLAISLVPAFIAALGGSTSQLQVSWQAHVGGLAVGALVGLIYARTRTIRRRRLQVALLVATGVVLLGLLALLPVIYG